MTALAVLAAAVCVVALLPPRGGGLKRLAARVTRRRRRRSWWIGAAGVLVVGLGVALRPVALVAVVGIAGGTVAWVVQARMRDKRALARAREVVRAAQLIESLVALGHLPGPAVTLAAEECPVLAPVAATVGFGGAGWEAMEQLAGVPGRAGLGEIGRAWRVSAEVGSPMHETLARVRANLEEAADTAAVVAGELAGARTTGQLLAVLPLAGLGLSYALGTDPTAFFLGGMGGRACLVAGIGLICAGVVWSEILARRARGPLGGKGPP